MLPARQWTKKVHVSKASPLIGLAGVIVAALGSELNDQVSGIALPDLTAHFGLSHDAATWFSSLYVSGEVVGMATAPWFAVTMTLRRFTLFVIAFSCVVTLLVPASHAPGWLFMMRTVQGFAGGLTIPLLMTTALRVLAPPIRLYGLAAYALTATFFTNLSTATAAVSTDILDWRFIYYLTVPLSALAGLLVWHGMPEEQPKYERFKQFDWRGWLLLVICSGALTTHLEQGDRLDWFNSQLICVLALISVVAVPLFLLNEWFHELPLLKLQLLARPNFAYGGIALFTFLVFGLSSSQVPLTFLESVAGYRPLQAAYLTLLIAASQLVLLPLLAKVLDYEWLDARWVSFAGLSLILAACIGDSYLDSDWNRNQFYLWQSLQAVGDAMVVMPLLMMSTNSVKPEEGPFASALINTPRALAEAVGVWLIDLIQRLRGSFHSEHIVDRLGNERFRLLQGQGSSLFYPAPLLPNGSPRSSGSLSQMNGLVQQQTTVLTLSDTFLVMAALAALLMLVLVVLPVRTYPPRIALAKH